MKKFALIASSLAMLSASPARAADPTVYEPTAPEFTWTGAYIGLQAGYGWGSSHLEFASGDNSDPDPDGFLGGVYVGFNYQLPSNVVLGAELDWAYSDMDGIAPGVAANGFVFPFPATNVTSDVNWTGAARIRIGYAMGRFLPYIAGGVAIADMDSVVTTPVGTLSVGDTYVGYTIGAGAEYAFTDNLIGRVEYRYSDFGDQDFPAAGGFFPGTIDLDTHDLRLGISFKF